MPSIGRLTATALIITIGDAKRSNRAVSSPPGVIGYIVKVTGNFSGALVFVACNALVAIVSYLLFVGEIKRVQLRDV